jgi:alpha-ketoglutarate-dependent taurine dioxygenase
MTTSFDTEHLFTHVQCDGFVKIGPLFYDRSLPVLTRPFQDDVNLVTWTGRNRDFVNSLLYKSGGILFRGFHLADSGFLRSFVEATGSYVLQYVERSSPRTQIGDRIYTSTDHPAHQQIVMHNENSYAGTWNLKICFLCVQAATCGGETPIADVRKVYARIDPAIRNKFESQGIMYLRNYSEGAGLNWRVAFGTSDRDKVEEYCRTNKIEFEWKSNDRLQTRQVRPAIARHPRTSEIVWFNHALFFNVLSLEPELREALLTMMSEEDLPTNTYYGDGSAIEATAIEHICDAYRQECVSFHWVPGDILLLDNMLTAHGRNSFTGQRRVLVVMADAWTDRGL